MKNLTLLLALILTPMQYIIAIEWDSQVYTSIEHSVQKPDTSGHKHIPITRFGAKPDATAAHNQKAIQKAIDYCSRHGGGKVIVPARTRYITGAISLKSMVNLVIEEDATLEFAFQPQLYPIVETSWEGIDCYNLSPCIYAFRAHDIAITGKGTIDGGASKSTWWTWCGASRYGWKENMPSQRNGARQRLYETGEEGTPMRLHDGQRAAIRTFTKEDALRPQLIGINQCKRILIEGVTLLRSPFWVIHPLKSEDITVTGATICNNGPNGDGCDPESCNRVIIEHCSFNTGDDCIAIKSGRNADGRRRSMPSQNIIVRHCTMRNGHGGVVIGSEVSGGCHDVFVHDCHMDSPNLDRVLRIKTNTCRGGDIRNIFMKDVTVGQCREAVLKINLNYESREACRRGFYPSVSNVLMENVTCQKSNHGIQINGLDEGYFVHDITLRNCHFSGISHGNVITGKVQDIDTSSCTFSADEHKNTQKGHFSDAPRFNLASGR